ncbi:MBOAT family protein [bacterium]|nr:MBOAT family protein [bacterium]
MTEKIIPGFEPICISHIILPIGVSFFTFQAMSYVFDVARGRSAPLRNPVDFSMYICMFPQLIAGPIVRYHEIAGQIQERSVTLDRFGQGAARFCLGLFKKVVLADSIAVLADHVFSISGGLSTGLAWMGLLAFTIQVYFDFSGYSDMAIGLGHLFGFKLPENFNRPYLAISVTDFWRRWHISLSHWFRDYVYIPLGGSRVAGWRVSLNLFTVFILVGFWHGANWTFIALGLYHGFWLSIERFYGYGRTEKPRNPWLHRIATFLIVMLGMVLFRAENLAHAAGFYRTLFTWQAGTASLPPDYEMGQGLIWLAIGAMIVFLSGTRSLGVLMENTTGWRVNLLKIGIVTIGMLLTSMMIVSRHYNPFIYFQF